MKGSSWCFPDFGSSKKLYRRGFHRTLTIFTDHAALLLPATADEPRRGGRGQADPKSGDAPLHAPRRRTKPYWGAAATVDDCFDAEIVDDGVVSVTEFTHVDEQGVTVQYYYWLARFGGNVTGHVIRGCAPPSTTGDILHERVVASSLLGGPWVAVAQNVDDDLTWTCPTNPAPEGFMDRLRAVVERD